MSEAIGLCHRCEYRALVREGQHGPRHECNQIAADVYSCYMYKPVKPIVLERNGGDERPIGTPSLCGPRYHAVRIADVELHGDVDGEVLTLYWRPRGTSDA